MKLSLKRCSASLLAAALLVSTINFTAFAQDGSGVGEAGIKANSIFQAEQMLDAGTSVGEQVGMNDFAPDSASFGGSFQAGDHLCYSEIDFGSGEFNTCMLLLSALSTEEGKTIEVRIDSPDGNKVAEFSIQTTQDLTTFQEQYASVAQVTGMHDVYLVFPQDTDVNIDWFTFSSYNGTETAQQKEERMQWWNDCRFGQFIHFGAYSYLEGEYEGRIQKGHGAEWIMGDFKIPREDYEQKVAKQFNPTNFDAKEIVSLAKAAGQKYLVFTSRHHEGFSMFDTHIKGFGDYKITTYGNYEGEDPVKALARECKEQGIHFGVYYTIMEWHDPSQVYPAEHSNQIVSEEAKLDFKSRIKGQLRELVVDYGAEILFFDGTWNSWWNQQDGRELYRYLRTLNPDLIVNNRVGKSTQSDGDYGTPEQSIPATGLGYDWESCMTLNDTWGFNKHDNNWKSPATVVKNLVDCASKGGNYLLNIGPDKLGDVPEQSVSILTQVGEWLEANGESIYGTDHSCFESLTGGMKATVKDGKIYLHLFNWTSGSTIQIPRVDNKVLGVQMLATDNPVNYTVMRDSIAIDLPVQAADPYDTVIEIDVEGYPTVSERQDNLSLQATSVAASNTYKNNATYAPDKAVDGKADTRWATDDNTKSATLELGFDQPVTVNQVTMKQFISSVTPNNNKINAYQIEYMVNGEWKVAYSGTNAPKDVTVDFPAVTSDRFRLNLTDCLNPTLYEFEMRNLAPAPEVAITTPSETSVAHLPFTITGTSKNASEVEVALMGVNFSPVLHKVPVDENGNWSIVIDDQVDGYIQVKAQVKDAYDEVLALDAINLNVRAKELGVNLAAGKSCETSSSYSAAYNGSKALDGDLGTRWSPVNGDLNAYLTVQFGEPTLFDTVVLCEMFDTYNDNIDYRCLAFKLEALIDGVWTEVHQGRTIGEKLTVTFPEVTAQELKLTFLDCEETKNQAPPNLLEFEVYCQGTEPPVVESNKTVLKQVIDYATKAKAGGEYAGAIDDVRLSFDAALQAAQDVYDNPSATQADVDSAWMKLMNEIHKLGFQRGSTDQLQLVYDQAASLDLNNYVEQGQEYFLQKRSDALALLENPGNALQAEVDIAVEELLSAMMDLRYKADKSILSRTVARVKGIDLSLYTQASALTFESALAQAEEILADETLSVLDQSRVNQAVSDLQAAYEGLQAEAISTVKTGDNALTAGVSAKTGDGAPVCAAVSLFVLASFAAGLSKKRRRR